jgi:hypothetical protein
MNNTTTTKGNLSLVAIFMAATLLIGTFATTTIGTTQSSTAFAYSQKKKGDDNNSRNGNTVTIEDCKNKGSASGFDTAVNQECENLICTHPGDNASCVQEGAAAAQTPVNKTQPVTLTCEQCLTKFLNAGQISILSRGTNDLALTCGLLSLSTTESLQRFLVSPFIGLSESAAAQLIQCMIDAGVQFGTRPT